MFSNISLYQTIIPTSEDGSKRSHCLLIFTQKATTKSKIVTINWAIVREDESTVRENDTY